MKEKFYDIVHGVRTISKYFSSDLTFESLNEATNTYQLSANEFQLLKWIRANFSSDRAAVTAEAIEFELWKETVTLLPIQGVQSILDFLVKKNIRVAAISNAIFRSPCMAYELEKHALNKYFEFVVSSAGLGIRKPDPRIFEAALKKLDLKPQDVWFIGDKWDTDIVGANAVQMTPVWFNEFFSNHDASIEHIKLQQWSDFEVAWNQRTSS